MDLDNFIDLGRSHLTPYLGRLDEYLTQLPESGSSDRDDIDFLSTPPEKYIRNLLCVSVLNRIYRDEFLKTDRKMIVLPECLKDYGPDTCCRIKRKNFAECTQCLPDCHVNIVDESFVNRKTEMILEPDDTDLMAADLRQKHGTVGIVGVACVLTLAPGFKDTLKYKHPTQGVFLNYSSCKYHWAPKSPYNTRFSLARLAHVLDRIPPEQKFDPPLDGETYSLENQPGSTERLYEILDELAEQFYQKLLPTYQNIENDIYETGLTIIDDILGQD